jgi:hypothetical protein
MLSESCLNCELTVSCVPLQHAGNYANIYFFFESTIYNSSIESGLHDLRTLVDFCATILNGVFGYCHTNSCANGDLISLAQVTDVNMFGTFSSLYLYKMFENYCRLESR